jgi:hypothetical protein
MTIRIRRYSIKRIFRLALAALLLLIGMAAPGFAHASDAGIAGEGSYQDLVGLFDEFLAF